MGLFSSDDDYPDREEHEQSSDRGKFNLTSEVYMRFPDETNKKINVKDGDLYNLSFTEDELFIPFPSRYIQLSYNEFNRIDFYYEAHVEKRVVGEPYVSMLDISHTNHNNIETHILIINNKCAFPPRRGSARGENIEDEETKEKDSKLNKISKFVQRKSDNYEENTEYCLHGYMEKLGKLEVEDWSEATGMTGSVSGQGESEGKSKGIQVGPFIRSKTKTTSEFEGNISGSIGSSNFSSELQYAEINESGIFADSDPVLDIGYEEIDRVLKRDEGMTIMWNGTTIQITNIKRDNLDEWIGYVREQMNKVESNESESDLDEWTENELDKNKPSEKLRELKQLHDDEIINSEEFEQKKEELLDEF